MSRVLVTDGSERASLAVVRSLGAAGHRVFVCSSHEPKSIAGGSRFSADEAHVPDPTEAPSAFCHAVWQLVECWRIDLLIPITDASLLAIQGDEELRTSVTVPFPGVAEIRRLADKVEVARAANRVGIAVPKSRVVNGPDDLENSDLDSLSAPYVIKPGRSLAEDADGSRRKFTVSYAADPKELERNIKELQGGAFPVIIQECIDGPGVGIFLLLWEDRLIARFAHRRIREKPPSGGVSVYRESKCPPEELFERSVQLLREFDWHGVAMVEYKVHQATGTPYVMEVNGRFWGSLQLAVDGGVDFPRLLVESAEGRSPAPVLDYRDGVRCRWWWGDVDHLLACLRTDDDAWSPSASQRSFLRALGDFLILWRPGDRSEVLRPSDPVPFLRETGSWFRGLGSNG